ncbi:hypothetical protein [Bradyrhizobium sp. RD5-C2]|uniref:hypothetical protein n=1 Tax=Bradyrhizobium sp. RD5-C2 TaxID=244562 RepID=UPI001CC5D045|nr:hypothetical protein [Bradyrhizobium sp. RD5-C2]GIQ75839.1 hypothetical protein BraRD5C2_42820 [Bradyrhizobium sp. RD5-C2]
MRKLILITAVVLASASAQAGERSLSLGGAGSLPAAASNSVNAADKVADAPAAPAVAPPPMPPEAPKYVERAAPVAAPAPQPQAQPALQQAPVQQQANVQPSAVSYARPAPEQRTTSYRSSRRRHARRWTEGRIIGELHRHGIYW